jgi:hypothetical protein
MSLSEKLGALVTDDTLAGSFVAFAYDGNKIEFFAKGHAATLDALLEGRGATAGRVIILGDHIAAITLLAKALPKVEKEANHG